MRLTKTWWGIVLITILTAIATVFLFFVIITGWYWFQIKNGKADMNSLNQSNSMISGLNQAKRIELESGDDPYAGNPAAKLVIVEFVDYKCPNCFAAHPIMQKVMANYSHKVKLIIRDFPAESIHPGATELAELAYCANLQNKFWKLQDILYTQQNSLPEILTTSTKLALYNEAGLNSGQTEKCLRSDQAKIEVSKDFSDGVKFGAIGTPTFFVNGKKVEGVVSYDSWMQVIEATK